MYRTVKTCRINRLHQNTSRTYVSGHVNLDTYTCMMVLCINLQIFSLLLLLYLSWNSILFSAKQFQRYFSFKIYDILFNYDLKVVTLILFLKFCLWILLSFCFNFLCLIFYCFKRMQFNNFELPDLLFLVKHM